ncbi:MAG: LPS export ABC transporter ATP-binding protein [Gammaproteobacteria bacterium]|nr:LPS export ABC transporter ATP-binding protein [Gammaproteobacteria bacterium]|tara:strand:+ start:887 stop:1615 length:729 start_codon:yes stop_codon:yes gene_type:complete
MSSLVCKNLIKKYGDKAVVNDINISLETKKVVGLLGPNGAGKTTTFFIIVGLIRCNSGQINIDGNSNIIEHPMHLRAKMGISYLPQEASIFRNLTAKDNILAILETRNDLNKKQKKERFDELVDKLRIKNILNTIGSSLSGGERRRVEIARALTTDPKFLLLDEPFAGIDPISVIDIQAIIKSLADSGIGVLITDHNVRETLGVCNEAYIISSGRVIAKGSASDIVKDKTVREVYLGKDFKL